MVICKYFQTGNCRFGSKCVNEHFDVKQYIKTEVEAALKGSQWPFSCFGLFKEKPCIPNFIEDQSYEEVRHMCYKARKENYFPAYQQQFTQQVMEAQNKMKTLLTLSREVVDAMIKLYDDAEIAQKGVSGTVQHQQQQQQQPQTSANPFSLGSSSLGQSNLFGNNLQPNPFASANSNFGGSNISQGSVFGAQAITSPTANILGQSAFGSSGFGSNSIFGGGQQTSSFTLNQLGQQQSSTGQQAQGGNIFSMNSQLSQPSAGSVFGGNVQQTQQQTAFPSGNNFGVNSGQSNIFGQQPQQQQSVSGGNLFTQQNQPTTGGYAGGFGQPQGNSNFDTSQTPGIFGQHLQQQTQQQQMHLQQQQMQQQQQQQQQQSGQNILGPGVNMENAFSQRSQQDYMYNSNQTPAFATTNQGQQSILGQPQQQPFQQAPQPLAPVANTSDSVYSKMEDLCAEEIEAFRAEEFVLGKIPTNPPPRDLVY